MNRDHEPGRQHRGMVLVAVLWIMVALSIIVTGLVQAVRSEVRLVSGAREAVVAQALGDAAIHLVLQDMTSNPEKIKRLTQRTVSYQGQNIEVQVMPLNGLIDINQAPKALLASLFTLAGGLVPGAAQSLAQAVIEARTHKDSRGLPEGFEANEDLLRVSGVDYDLYANIRALITADQPASGKVNPLAAPPAVLQVLAGGDAQRAGDVATRRDAGQAGVDTTTTLTAAYIDDAGTERFEIKARVMLPSGVAMLVSRSVDLGDGQADGLPWRTFRTENKFEPVNGKAH